MGDRVKQVIVVNLAAPMELGRLVAQACHSAVLNVLSRGSWNEDTFSLTTQDFALKWWMKEQFTKVVCKAWGDDQMLAIKKEAEDNGLYVAMMQEDGYITSIAIGPAEIEKFRWAEKLPLL